MSNLSIFIPKGAIKDACCCLLIDIQSVKKKGDTLSPFNLHTFCGSLRTHLHKRLCTICFVVLCHRKLKHVLRFVHVLALLLK